MIVEHQFTGGISSEKRCVSGVGFRVMGQVGNPLEPDTRLYRSVTEIDTITQTFDQYIR